jgi:hypothetical protein
MRYKILYVLNVIIAVATSALIWVMLPYARGVACDTTHSAKDCEPLGFWGLLGNSSIPIFIAIFLVSMSHYVKNRYPKSAIVMLCLLPITVAGLFINGSLKP